VAKYGKEKGFNITTDSNTYEDVRDRRNVEINNPTGLDMAFRKNNILFLAFESEVNANKSEEVKKEELQRLFDLDAKIKVLSCWAPDKKFDNFREELEKHILRFLSDRKFDGVFGLFVYTNDYKKHYVALYSNDIDKKCKIIQYKT
jgi:hypothetical protein